MQPALRVSVDVDSKEFASLCETSIAAREPKSSSRSGAPGKAAEATACILYTSGTTGRPKGAMLTHLNISHSVMHYKYCLALSTRRIVACLSVPASHVTGLIAPASHHDLRREDDCWLVDEFKAATFLEEAASERVSFSVMVPAMYKLCLLQPDFATYDLSSWRIGVYGGAPMAEDTIEKLATKLPSMLPLNAYGATETTSPVTIMPLGLGREHADSVGVVVPCADVAVMDDEGKELKAGQPGELWISGPMVVAGYWDNPEATAKEFTGGYWHSGDIGVHRRGWLRQGTGPEERHAEPRRLQDLLSRSRERAGRLPGSGRSCRAGPTMCGAGRTGPRLHSTYVTTRASISTRCAITAPGCCRITRCQKPLPSAPSRCRAMPMASS